MIRPKNIFQQLQVFEQEIRRLQGKILDMEVAHENERQLLRNHLVRIKNKEEVSDDFIMSGKPYQDLSPDKAWSLYQNKDLDFIVIDVTEEYYEGHHLPEAVRIPWSVFHERFYEIQAKTTPIFIISEDGTNSVLACQYLAKRGYFNCNNVSGGYKHWNGFRLDLVKEA